MKKLFPKDKILALVLVFLFIFPVNSQMVSATETLKSSTITSAKAEKNIHGFSLKKDCLFDKHSILEYQHEKSGAWLIVEKNNNINKKFEIIVRTPAENDKGTNHVIEHCVLNGSNEFPCKSIIWELQKIAHATLINAYTCPCFTAFHTASTDKNDYNSLAKIYASSVFHPSFLKNENIFKKEGIRFELDKNGNITPNGTVFNEMQKGVNGNTTNHLLKNIFPDTQSKNFSGGLPEKIMNLTYEEVCNTYKKYYHPANMIIYISGDVDYEEMMDWLNKDYLQHYNKDDFKGVSYLSQDPQKVAKYSSFDYYKADAKENLKESVFSKILDWETYKTHKNRIDAAISILNDPNSAQNKYLKEKGYVNVIFSYNEMLFDPFITVNVESLNKNLIEFKNFSNILKETLEKHPINQSSLKNYENGKSFKDKISKKSRLYETRLDSKCFINSFIRFGDPCSEKYFLQKDTSEKIEEPIEETVNKIFLNNDYITTEFKASNNLNLCDSNKLKEKIESLDSRKEELTKNYKEQKQWAESPNDPENLQKLKKMFKKLSDIETPNFKCPTDVTKDKNINYYFSKQDIGNFISYKFVFKFDKISDDEKKYIDLLINSLNSNDTKNYSREELKDKESDCCETNISFKAFKKNNKDESFIIVDTICNKKNSEKVFDLINERINNVKFNDKKNLSNFTKSIAASYNNISTVTLKFMDVILNLSNKSFQKQLDIQNFYNKLSSNLENQKYVEELSQKLVAMRDKIFNINSIEGIGITACEENKDFAMDIAKKFTNTLNTTSDNKTFEINFVEVPKKNIAFIEPNLTNNQVYAVIESEELSNDPTFGATCKLLNTLFLNHEIREKSGAYGASIVNLRNNNKVMLCSYQDPNIRKTIEIFKKIPEFIKNYNFNSQEIDDVAKSLLGTLFVKNKLALSNSQLEKIICEEKDYCEIVNKNIEEIKKMSPEQIRLHGELLEKALKDMKVYVFGGKVNEDEKNIFDEIVK